MLLIHALYTANEECGFQIFQVFSKHILGDARALRQPIQANLVAGIKGYPCRSYGNRMEAKLADASGYEKLKVQYKALREKMHALESKEGESHAE